MLTPLTLDWNTKQASKETDPPKTNKTSNTENEPIHKHSSPKHYPKQGQMSHSKVAFGALTRWNRAKVKLDK